MKKKELEAMVSEAEELLRIAWVAMSKLRLEGRGSDLGLAHEVRMFAAEFSLEKRDGPGTLQIKGTGRYHKWRRAVMDAKLPPAETRPEGRMVYPSCVCGRSGTPYMKYD